MKATIFTKDNCPFCVKAKELLKQQGIDYKEFKVQTIEDLRAGLLLWTNEELKTVPQILITENDSTRLLGGYEDLRNLFRRKTVFNEHNTGYKTKHYPLFLGEDPGLTDTINVAYPILDSLFQQQMSQLWNEFEISLTQDRQDMLTAPPDVVDKMVRTISWQHLADSVASRAITGILMEYVSNTELESWYNAVALFETIHAKTYSHIVKQTFKDPIEMLDRTYQDLEVLKRSSTLKRVFDDLANMPYNASQEEKEESVMLAVVALYLLESIAFMASFAVTFGIGETGIFQGITQDVILIARDELLHARGGLEVVKIVRSTNPEMYARLKPKIQDLFTEVINQETIWSHELFSGGDNTLVGLNAELLVDYIHYIGKPIANSLDINFNTNVTENPLPYMDKYLKTSKIQVAAQELQITSYLVDAIERTGPELYEELELMRKEFLNEDCSQGACPI